MTEGQLVIFSNIVFRFYKQLEIICCTQYGKSLWIALASLIISCIQKKVVAIIAPTTEKAKIIMRYYIEHLGDNILFYSQLEKNTKLERLRQEESKERIILRSGGGIFVLSVQQRNLFKSIEAAMGAGAEIVIIDEACLVQDETEATVFRMIGGQTLKGKSDAFYCKVGNPFYSVAPNSHFKTDWDNPEIGKIFIDYDTALKEGRYTQEFIANAFSKPLADILYTGEFPSEDIIDREGYRQLILSDNIRMGDVSILTANPDILKLGVDIGGGKDKNVYTLRREKQAMVVGENLSKDTMTNVRELERIHQDFRVPWNNMTIDDIGIGRGVTDRCLELGYDVNPVGFGDAPKDKETFANIKAELFWATKLWAEAGGLLEKRKEWFQLTWIKWKQQTGEKKILLEPKERLRAKKHASPDYADSLALTFYEKPFIGFI